MLPLTAARVLFYSIHFPTRDDDVKKYMTNEQEERIFPPIFFTKNGWKLLFITMN